MATSDKDGSTDATDSDIKRTEDLPDGSGSDKPENEDSGKDTVSGGPAE